MKYYHVSPVNMNVMLLNLMLIICDSALVLSYDFTFPSQDHQNHQHQDFNHQQQHRSARSENSPRLMVIDLSALSSRHHHHPSIDTGNFGPKSTLKLVDLSVLTRNPEPRLPLAEAVFPDPWDPIFPVFPGREQSLPPIPSSIARMPVKESDNMLDETETIYGGGRFQDERKKPVEPNTEDNGILIFPGIQKQHLRPLPVYRRTYRQFKDYDSMDEKTDDVQNKNSRSPLLINKSGHKTDHLFSLLLQNEQRKEDDENAVPLGTLIRKPRRDFREKPSTDYEAFYDTK